MMSNIKRKITESIECTANYPNIYLYLPEYYEFLNLKESNSPPPTPLLLPYLVRLWFVINENIL